MNTRAVTLFLTLALFGNLTAYSQVKNGYFVFYGKDRPEAGIAPTGKVEEGKFVDDRKEGEWVKYHRDGKTPKLRGDFVNNRPSGMFYKYYENGILKEEGKFVDGQYTDSLKRYYDSGQLEYAAFYNAEGKEDGLVKYYYRNGQPQLIYTAKNGERIGEEKRFDSFGKPLDSLGTLTGVTEANATDLYRQKKTAPAVKVSQENGYNIVMNASGEKDQEGDFKNGLLFDGKRYIYDQSGILTQVEIYKEGYLHSYGQF